ncbi:hypothetical protein LINPERPRIM_LOCUS30578 [Linum perenne]
MKMAWALGVKKLNIQTDSRTVVSLFSSEDSVSHQHAALVMEFKELQSRRWDTSLKHVY